MRAPASLKMRRRTEGIVTIVGPMSKRKPSPRSWAALPPSQSLRSKRTTLYPRAASTQAAESPPRPPPMMPICFMSLFSLFDCVDECADEIDNRAEALSAASVRCPDVGRKKPRIIRAGFVEMSDVSFRDIARRHAETSFRAGPRCRACCRIRSHSLRRTAYADRRSGR